MNTSEPVQIESIPISDIHVLNPRTRSRRIHTELVENIRRVGLKRPVTVSRRAGVHRQPYDLVCGQGRIEALQVLVHLVACQSGAHRSTSRHRSCRRVLSGCLSGIRPAFRETLPRHRGFRPFPHKRSTDSSAAPG